MTFYKEELSHMFNMYNYILYIYNIDVVHSLYILPNKLHLTNKKWEFLAPRSFTYKSAPIP